MVWFASTDETASNGQCIALESDNHATCPSTSGFPTDLRYTLGPVPRGGATVAQLFVQLDANAAGSGNQVSILDNGTSVLTCTVPDGASTCSSSDSASVAAGDYLQVQVATLSGASSRRYRVSFRY